MTGRENWEGRTASKGEGYDWDFTERKGGHGRSVTLPSLRSLPTPSSHRSSLLFLDEEEEEEGERGGKRGFKGSLECTGAKAVTVVSPIAEEKIRSDLVS